MVSLLMQLLSNEALEVDHVGSLDGVLWLGAQVVCWLHGVAAVAAAV
jgi:hypothetical protein